MQYMLCNILYAIYSLTALTKWNMNNLKLVVLDKKEHEEEQKHEHHMHWHL